MVGVEGVEYGLECCVVGGVGVGVCVGFDVDGEFEVGEGEG